MAGSANNLEHVVVREWEWWWYPRHWGLSLMSQLKMWYSNIHKTEMFQELFRLVFFWDHHFSRCHYRLFDGITVLVKFGFFMFFISVSFVLATWLARYQFELNSDTGGRVFLNGTEISPSYDSSVLPGVCFMLICPQVPPFFHSVASIEHGGMITCIFTNSPGVRSGLRLRSQWQCFEYGVRFGTRSLGRRMVLSWVG